MYASLDLASFDVVWPTTVTHAANEIIPIKPNNRILSCIPCLPYQSRSTSNYTRLVAQPLSQFDRAFFRITVTEELSLFSFLRQVNLFNPLMRWLVYDLSGRCNFPNLFLL